MDTNDLKNPLDAENVAAFMKTEAFYLAVVIFIAVIAMSSTFISFTQDYASGPGRTIINQKEFFDNYKDAVSNLRQNNPGAAAFPMAVDLFNRILLWVGGVPCSRRNGDARCFRQYQRRATRHASRLHGRDILTSPYDRGHAPYCPS